MPMIVRAAHVDEVPEGTAITVKLRAGKVRLARVGGVFYAFDAAGTSLPAKPAAADIDAARRDGVPFRAVVRGAFVHVALDADRQSARADVRNHGAPEAARP
jgi:hypothetical protein